MECVKGKDMASFFDDIFDSPKRVTPLSARELMLREEKHRLAKMEEQKIQKSKYDYLLRQYAAQQNYQGGLNGFGQDHQALYGNPYAQAYLNAYIGTHYAADPGAAKKAAEEKHRAIPAEGIRAGEIIAYRCWQFSKSQLWLKSYSANKMWNPGEPMEGDVVQYGVHCFKHLPYADEYCINQGTPHIIGTIEIWGEIVEHENGYRAQYAAIKSLDFLVNCKGDKETILREMRQRYKLAA